MKELKGLSKYAVQHKCGSHSKDSKVELTSEYWVYDVPQEQFHIHTVNQKMSKWCLIICKLPPVFLVSYLSLDGFVTEEVQFKVTSKQGARERSFLHLQQDWTGIVIILQQWCWPQILGCHLLSVEWSLFKLHKLKRYTLNYWWHMYWLHLCVVQQPQ